MVTVVLKELADCSISKMGGRKTLRQYVIVMRGRFATWKSLALDLDIMVEVHANTKE